MTMISNAIPPKFPAPKTELQERFDEAKAIAAKADATHWRKCAAAVADGDSLNDKELARLVEVCDRRNLTLELFEGDCEVLREERQLRDMAKSLDKEREAAVAARLAAEKRLEELRKEVAVTEQKHRASTNTIARADEHRRRHDALLRMNPRVLGADLVAAVSARQPAVDGQAVGRELERPYLPGLNGSWLGEKREI